jgi:hypothetical protein
MAAAAAAAMATRVEVHVLPPPAAAGHSIFDFGHTTELINSGYLLAKAALADRSSILVA